MTINVVGQNIDLNQQHDRLVHEKLGKQLDKYLDKFNPDMKIADVRIKQRTRWGYLVSFSMGLPGKKKIYANEVGESLETAIRKLRADVERQLKQYRGRLGVNHKTTVSLKHASTYLDLDLG